MINEGETDERPANNICTLRRGLFIFTVEPRRKQYVFDRLYCQAKDWE